MLVAYHLNAMSLPGCGPGSGCAELAKGRWGTLPVLGWPVSHAGLAYFLGLLAAWLASSNGVNAGLRNLVRLGVLGSLGFTVIMFVERHSCPYCIVVHVGNIAFWIILECSRRAATRSPRWLASAAGTFVLATVVLIGVEAYQRGVVHERGERDLGESTARIIEATRRAQDVAAGTGAATSTSNPADEPAPETAAPAAAPAPAVAAARQPVDAPPAVSAPEQSSPQSGGQTVAVPPLIGSTEPADQGASECDPDADAAHKDAPAADAAEDPFAGGFRGRYLLGPEKAAVRIVIITDYQCRDCKSIEDEIRGILEAHPNDVSLSVKHFPFDEKCNSTATRTLHPNACWAARAAEAAGILWGNDGFWEMHHWLFDHEGTFTKTEELTEAIRGFGRSPSGFITTMTGDETLRLVEQDIAEARLLGLYQTPLVFINGVELRGWQAKDAVARAVNAVLAANPEPQTHEFDRPPLAVQKCVDDWRARRLTPAQRDQYPRVLGSTSPKVRIVLYGDYQTPLVAEVDEIFRAWVAQHDNAHYTYRHFPFDQTCNPSVSSTQHEQACWAARVAEAAWFTGGDEAFWKMHTWLLANQDSLNETAVAAAATELGLDAEALIKALDDPEVAAAVEDDAVAGRRGGLKRIPWIVVNNRVVERWRLTGPEFGREVLESILKEAAGN
jgi:protein-disulfide isomerase/uncharacterized membrane protein